MPERVSLSTAEAREGIRAIALLVDDTELAVHLSLVLNGILRRLDDLEDLVQEVAHELEARR